MAGKDGFSKAKKRDEAVLTERVKLSASDKIKELEEDIAKVKYNKATQYAVGLMKAKLAMLKERATQRSSGGKSGGDDRFSVRKTGDATAILLGYPSVGKSTLLNKITNAKSDVAAYSFTTLRAIPGLMDYKFAKIQVVDVPGIVSGAASGRGRGREVLSLLRSADLILILVDALNPDHYEAILQEVYETGVRINEKKPDVRIIKKERGGITIGTTIALTNLDNRTITGIAREFKLNNVDISIREDIDQNQLIDVMTGDKIYTKALTILTRIDLIDKEKLSEISERIKPDIAISAELGIGIDELKELIYTKMEFIRIYLKEVNKQPDMKEPLIMMNGCKIEDICNKLHKDFIDKFKYARIWGKSVKFDGQSFRRLDRELLDEDIIEIHIK